MPKRRFGVNITRKIELSQTVYVMASTREGAKTMVREYFDNGKLGSPHVDYPDHQKSIQVSGGANEITEEMQIDDAYQEFD